MMGLLRTIQFQKQPPTLVPLTLAVVVAVLGALVYLELVSMLIAYAG
ncbi:hypothetical protein [Natronorubrum sp. DTA28]